MCSGDSVTCSTVLGRLLPICKFNRREKLAFQNKIWMWTVTMLWSICHQIKSLSESFFASRGSAWQLLRIILWWFIPFWRASDDTDLSSFPVLLSLKCDMFVMLLPWAAQSQLQQQLSLLRSFPANLFLPCQGSWQLPGDAVTQHLPFSGHLKTKFCLLGFLISQQLGGPEVPHLVAIQGFLPGWLGPFSSVFFLRVDSLGNTDPHMCPHTGILGNTES